MELYLGKRLGFGSESTSYETLDGENVIKVPHRFGRLWQTAKANYIRDCISVLKDAALRIIDVEVIDFPEVFYGDNQAAESPEFVLKVPKIPNFEDRRLSLTHLTDIESGANLIRKLMDYLRADKALYHRGYGLDLLGGQALIDGIRALIKSCTMKALGRFDFQKIAYEGRFNNLLVMDDPEGQGLLLTDVGMHDLSRAGKFKSVTSLLHYIALSAMIQAVPVLNDKLQDSKLSDNEMEELNDLHSHVPKWIFDLTGDFFSKIYIDNVARH